MLYGFEVELYVVFTKFVLLVICYCVMVADK